MAPRVVSPDIGLERALWIRDVTDLVNGRQCLDPLSCKSV